MHAYYSKSENFSVVVYLNILWMNATYLCFYENRRLLTRYVNDCLLSIDALLVDCEAGKCVRFAELAGQTELSTFLFAAITKAGYNNYVVSIGIKKQR